MNRRREHARGSVDLTVALPVYNEDKILEHLHALLTTACRACGVTYELLFVNDGSSDGTGAVLEGLAGRDSHVTVIAFSRNFGHPAALAAAIDCARGRSLVLMDSDLQDDPAVIPELLRLQRDEQAEVVYVVRAGRPEGVARRSMVGFFHWVLSKNSLYPTPYNAGSFGLIGPRALAEVRRLTERLRYFPGLRAFVGFRQVALEVPRAARYDETPRHRIAWLFRYAGLALFSQSRVAVNIFYVLSAISLLASAVLATYAVVGKILGHASVGWASLITSVAFIGSIIILGQAIICEYLSRIYEESRGRPLYVIDRIIWSSADVLHRDEPAEYGRHGLDQV